MTTTRMLLAYSVVALFAGCVARVEPTRTVVREPRGCPPAQHWEDNRCIDNRHDHDRDHDRDHDHDHDHDHDR
jgi:ABC-type Zn2+ transport system substrate-binding protein/surface adhesin